jgi:hypothetical protein
VKATPGVEESMKVVLVGAAAYQVAVANESWPPAVPEAVGHAVPMAPPLPVKPVRVEENQTAVLGCSAIAPAEVNTLFAVDIGPAVMETVEELQPVAGAAGRAPIFGAGLAANPPKNALSVGAVPECLALVVTTGL